MTNRNWIKGQTWGVILLWKGDARQLTVTYDGKSSRTIRKGKNLPWEISESEDQGEDSL